MKVLEEISQKLSLVQNFQKLFSKDNPEEVIVDNNIDKIENLRNQYSKIDQQIKYFKISFVIVLFVLILNLLFKK